MMVVGTVANTIIRVIARGKIIFFAGKRLSLDLDILVRTTKDVIYFRYE